MVQEPEPIRTLTVHAVEQKLIELRPDHCFINSRAREKHPPEDHNTYTIASSRIHILKVSLPALEVSDVKKRLLAREKMTESQRECLNNLEARGLLGRPHAVDRCVGRSFASQRDHVDRIRTEAMWWLYQ